MTSVKIRFFITAPLKKPGLQHPGFFLLQREIYLVRVWMKSFWAGVSRRSTMRTSRRSSRRTGTRACRARSIRTRSFSRWSAASTWLPWAERTSGEWSYLHSESCPSVWWPIVDVLKTVSKHDKFSNLSKNYRICNDLDVVLVFF